MASSSIAEIVVASSSIGDRIHPNERCPQSVQSVLESWTFCVWHGQGNTKNVKLLSVFISFIAVLIVLSQFYRSFISVLWQFYQCFIAGFISVLSKFSFVWANPRDGRLAHPIGIHP